MKPFPSQEIGPAYGYFLPALFNPKVTSVAVL